MPTLPLPPQIVVRRVCKCHTLTLTKLAGNQASLSSFRPHHQSLLEASRTWMTSPALKPSSWSSMVTWSHKASAQTTLPSLISCSGDKCLVQNQVEEEQGVRCELSWGTRTSPTSYMPLACSQYLAFDCYTKRVSIFRKTKSGRRLSYALKGNPESTLF